MNCAGIFPPYGHVTRTSLFQEHKGVPGHTFGVAPSVSALVGHKPLYGLTWTHIANPRERIAYSRRRGTEP